MAAVHTDVELVGRAADFVRQSGREIRFCDLYDEHGAMSYHIASQNDPSEIFEFVQIVRDHEGPILELACGSGRLVLPLVAAGHQVTALDNSTALLEILQRRLSEGGGKLNERCTIVAADMADFDLNEVFEAIILGSTTVTLLDEAGQEGLLASVERHLAADGVFYVTVPVYNDEEPAHDTHLHIETDEVTVDLFSHAVAGDTFRTVTCCSVASDGVMNVALSQPALFDREQFDRRVEAAGFAVSDVFESLEVAELQMRSGLLRLRRSQKGSQA